MKNIKIRTIIIIDKYAIRLNHPKLQGILGKIDRFIFNYYYPKRKYFYIPCFLPLPKFKKQLIVENIPIYTGGGVNCFNEPLKIYPVIVNKKTLKHCIEAYNNKYFKIRKFEYNGFSGRLYDGYIKEVAINITETNDPGIYVCKTNKNNTIIVPSFALEGIEITYKPKENNNIPLLFGISSKAI